MLISWRGNGINERRLGAHEWTPQNEYTVEITDRVEIADLLTYRGFKIAATEPLLLAGVPRGAIEDMAVLGGLTGATMLIRLTDREVGALAKASDVAKGTVKKYQRLVASFYVIDDPLEPGDEAGPELSLDESNESDELESIHRED